MANPQAENGHTDIANDVMEALSRIRIPGESRQVLDFIIRKTWGYKKKEDWISLSQFVLGTGLKKVTVIKARKKLIEMNLISITQKGNDKDLMYSFNKDFEEWKPLPKKVTVTQKGNHRYPKRKSSLPKKVPTKENITKENITKYSSRTHFNKFWGSMPRSFEGRMKRGEDAAFNIWKKDITSEQAEKDIYRARDNYIQSEDYQKGFVMRGSKWMKDWKVWREIDKKPTVDIEYERTQEYLRKLENS